MCLTVQSHDLYVLPSDSYLDIEFTVARHDGVALIADDENFPQFFVALPIALYYRIYYARFLCLFQLQRCTITGISMIIWMASSPFLLTLIQEMYVLSIC